MFFEKLQSVAFGGMYVLVVICPIIHFPNGHGLRKNNNFFLSKILGNWLGDWRRGRQFLALQWRGEEENNV